MYASNDVVPFRLTPNMQHFLGPIFTEGILVSGIMAIGKALTEPEVKEWIVLTLYHFDETFPSLISNCNSAF